MVVGEAKLPTGLQDTRRAPGYFSSFECTDGKAGMDEVLALGSGEFKSNDVTEDFQDSSKSNLDLGATTSLTMCSRVVSDRSVFS